MHADWKHKGAGSYFKFLRSNVKAPRASFKDPAKDGQLTSKPEDIARIFTHEWQKVCTRPEGEACPSWERFEEKYGQYISKLPGLNTDPMTPEEMHSQALKFNPATAAGFDSWLPGELRKLPLRAWYTRCQVEALFEELATLPQV